MGSVSLGNSKYGSPLFMWKFDHVWAVDAKRQIRFTGVRSLPSLATNQCQFVCPHTCLAVVYSVCLPVVVVLVDVVLKYPVSFASACWEEWTGNINAVSESTLWNSEVFYSCLKVLRPLAMIALFLVLCVFKTLTNDSWELSVPIMFIYSRHALFNFENISQ